MASSDPMIMVLLFWAPVLLFLIVLVTILFAVFGGYGMEASPWRLLLYVGILLALTICLWWSITRYLMMGFT